MSPQGADPIKRLVWIVMLSLGLAARGAGPADAPVGQWQTVDEKSGAVDGATSLFIDWIGAGGGVGRGYHGVGVGARGPGVY